MTERVLLLPPVWASAEIVESLPAPARAVRTLRDRAEVDVFRWPGVPGGPSSDPTWEGFVEVLSQALAPGCHVLALGTAVSVALIALSRRSAGVRSFVANDWALPDVTLVRLGIGNFAAASAAGYRARSPGRRMPATLGRVDEQAADVAQAALDHSYVDNILSSWESLDLLAESPDLALPCLYVEAPLEFDDYPEGEATQLFLRFVPGAEVRRAKLWSVIQNFRPGVNVREAPSSQAGEEFAALVLEFIERIAAGTRLLTVLVTDIVDSTVHALEMGDQRWSRVLADHHALVRKQLNVHGGHEVDNAGDGFLATFESPVRAVRCASAIIEAVRSLGIEVRAGVHTGECEVIGEKVGGVAVHTGARIAASAGSSEVLVSQSVRDLIAGSDLQFDSGRTVSLKGLPGEWQLFALTAGYPESTTLR